MSAAVISFLPQAKEQDGSRSCKDWLNVQIQYVPLFGQMNMRATRSPDMARQRFDDEIFMV
jgi:hypothetical protein